MEQNIEGGEMTVKRLFTDKDEWTDEAFKLDREINEALSPIIQAWHARGYTLKEVAVLAYTTTYNLIVEYCLSSREQSDE